MKRSNLKRSTQRRKVAGKVDYELLRKYAAAHPKCELWPYFWEAMHPVAIQLETPPATDTHHIFGGDKRYDLLTNVVRVCRAIHDLDGGGGYGVHLRIASLWHKHAKGELDVARLNALVSKRPGTQYVQHWLETHCLPRGSYFERLRRKLIAALRTEELMEVQG